MPKKMKFKNRMSETLDLPIEIILDAPTVNIIANNEVTIENHKGILEFSNNILKVKTMLGIIKISGLNLTIKEIDQSDIIISGEIISIEYVK